MSWQKNTKRFFRRHVWAIAFSVIAGALSIAPHVLAVRAVGTDYRGIPFLYLDDEDIYLARMQEIVDGHASVGSAFFYEYKNAPALMPPYGEWVYVALSRVSGLSLPRTLVLAKFLFPALLFLLVYVFLSRLLPATPPHFRVFGSIAGGLLVVLGYDALSLRDMIAVLRGQDIGVRLSVWTRPVNPIVGALVVFSYLNLAWEALFSRQRWTVLAAGFFLGASVFYFFSWGALMSVTAILGLFFAIQNDWPRVRTILLVIFVGIAVSLPYWIGVLRSVGGETGRALAMRNGMFFTHAPLLNKTLLAALLVFFVAGFFLTRRDMGWKALAREPWWQICLALLLGGFIALNQQIVTGRTIWPYHFVQYTKPLAALVVLIAFVRLGKTRPKAVCAILVILSAYVFIQSVVAATTYRSVLPDFRDRQKDAELFSWLNTNAPNDCVVLTKENREYFDRLIPAFTHCNVYLSSWVFSGVPMDRVRHNFFIRLRLRGVTAEGAHNYLLAHPDLVRGAFFDDWKTVFATGTDDWLLRRLDELIPAYVTFLEQPFADALRRYRADYFITHDSLNEKERIELRVSSDPVNAGNVYLYSL